MVPGDQRTPTSILHDAARRYCVERIGTWHQKYAALGASGLDRVEHRGGSGDYTAEARDMFPRHNVLGAVLHDMERWVPDASVSVDDARKLLADIAATAQSAFTHSSNPIEVRAMEDERRLFKEFIGSCDIGLCATLPRMPFRRVLTDDEHAKLRAAFDGRWGMWYGGEVDRPVTPPHVTLHTAAMDAPGAYDTLRSALAELGVSRVLELRESGHGHEIDLASADFVYDGDESWWTSSGLTWMVYASHESSITFGGDKLIDAMRARLSGFERYLYRGWDLKLYS